MTSPSVINSRYEIRSIVGRGGMGLVYKAYDRVVGRDVALKTLGDIQERSALEMFYKEWRILANLHHPNIVEIFDIGEFEDAGNVKPFFVMPLLPGTNLEQLLRVAGPQLPPERLVEIISQTCRGLQAIHDAGLVHRDIKPSNIFVMELNSVKLIDFGVVHLLGGETLTGIKGTVSYMSPEQIRNQECTPASDIFSLGVVCYEALCGARPFQGGKSEEIFEAILHQPPLPVYELNPAISQILSRAVHKALAKEPRRRYRSSLEFAETLQRALRGDPIPEFDPIRIQPRIERATRAFEQGNYQMATDILGDLEAGGHIDPALKPLRNQIDQALRKSRIRELVERAKLGLEEEELALALQSAEAALKMEPANAEAAKLRDAIQAEMTRIEVEDCLREAEAAIGAFAFARCRQLLRKALQLRPGDAKAEELIQLVDAREREYRAARQEKEDLYRAAREASQNFEFVSAAGKLERVLELEAKAPDTASPESASNYSNFLSLVRSAQMMIDNTLSRAMEYVAQGEFGRAIDLCKDCISKFPGHPVPQGVALIAESEQKRRALLEMVALVEAIENEPDLEKKLALLRQATGKFPGETLFEQWMQPVKGQVALAKAIVAKARAREEQGRFQEALEQWQILRIIDPKRAGLEDEIARVAGLGAESSAPTLALARASGTPSAEPTAPTATSIASLPISASREHVGETRAPVENSGSVSTAVPPGPDAAAKLPPSKFARRSPSGISGAFRRNPLVYGTGSAAALLIGFAVIYTSAHTEPPKTSMAAPTRAKVVLRAGTPGAVIHLGTLTGAGGELQAQLAPGTYTVETELAGYKPYSGSVTVGRNGTVETLPALQPWPLALHITTDVQNAKIALDDQPPKPVTDGILSLDIPPGNHAITMAEGNRQARFEFVAADARTPELKDPITAKNLLAFAIASFGPDCQIHGSAALSSAAIDGAAPASGAAGNFQFAGLQSGAHQATVKVGTDERSIPIETGAHPGLWIALYSDRSVGALQVVAGVDQFQVFLDGVPYARNIQNKSMWIPNLPVRKYKLRVVADGYESPPERVVDVKKGSTSETVALTPVPQFGALAVRGAPPHTQVFIDGNRAFTTDADGNASEQRVPVGEHPIELRNPPQFKNKQLSVTLAKGETRTLSGADVRMDRNPSEVAIKGAPEGATVDYRCGEAPLQHGRLPMTMSCAEASLALRVSADGYTPDTRTVALNAGENSEQTFDLKRISAPVVTGPKPKTCGAADLPAHRWTAAENGWFVAAVGATLPCNDSVGTYEFAIRLPKGLLAGKYQVTIESAGRTGFFDLDKKSFSLPGKPKRDLSAYEDNGAVKFRVTIEPARIAFEAGKDSWKQLDSAQGDFRKIQLGFPAGVRIAQFTFKGK
jgi:serine/threonine protein kinase